MGKGVEASGICVPVAAVADLPSAAAALCARFWFGVKFEFENFYIEIINNSPHSAPYLYFNCKITEK